MLASLERLDSRHWSRLARIALAGVLTTGLSTGLFAQSGNGAPGGTATRLELPDLASWWKSLEDLLAAPLDPRRLRGFVAGEAPGEGTSLDAPPALDRMIESVFAELGLADPPVQPPLRPDASSPPGPVR